MIFPDAEAYLASGFAPRATIIGSGPAGITIARKLAAAGVPSVIFEAGAQEWSEDSQDVYRGTVVGDPYFDLDVTRLRYFGGSSNHWAGWCHLLDDVDFEPHDYIPNSGWPIRHADLEPFMAETHDILGIDPIEPDKPVTENFEWFRVVKSDPVRFAGKFRSELSRSRLIAVVLNTAVRELAGDGTRVTSARLWSKGASAGESVTRFYVAATGGIENSRLLLWSNECSNGGVVPMADALGRYWMEHPMYWTGNAVVANKAALMLDADGEAFLHPTANLLRELRLPNFHADFKTVPYYGVKHYMAEMACRAPAASEWVLSKLGKSIVCAARIHMSWAEPPVPENRVALSAGARDALGVPRVELHWKKSRIDRRVMIDGLRLIGEEFARRDIGRVQINDWVLAGGDYPTDAELAGNHHMGGTRMSIDPRLGVVDADCKVHGMRNLFVAGSSVFATAGQCTPTATITALALRLGDHLGKIAAAT